MSLTRRIRGLLGMALTWGVLGAVVGIPLYAVVFRVWNFTPAHTRRLLTTFTLWEGLSFTWGVACGLSFGIVLLALERRRPLHQLTPARVAAWGAVAGALFPAAITSRAILGGGDPFYFGGIIAASALTGAVWARMSVAIARRAPEPAALPLDPAGQMQSRTAFSAEREPAV